MPESDNYAQEWHDWQMEQYRNGVHHNDILRMSPELVPIHLRYRHNLMIEMSKAVAEEIRRQNPGFLEGYK